VRDEIVSPMPWPESFSAIARPIPREAPVMIADF
jgi:hypothetical protein